VWSLPTPTFSPGCHFVPARRKGPCQYHQCFPVLGGSFAGVFLISGAGQRFSPLCLNMMFPGATYSDADFLAPRRRPAESVGPLARPWVACEACRTKFILVRGGRIWCLEHKLREFNDDARAVRDVSADTTQLDNRGCSMAMVVGAGWSSL